MSFDRIYLISAQPHKKQIHYKHILLVLISLIIIVTSICLLINTKSNKEETQIAAQDIQQNSENEPENNVITAILEPESNKIPIYTDESMLAVNNIYKSDTKRVFLTFDDGPSDTVTPLILNILKENNINATFFVLGSRVELYPDILKRAYNEGNFIANHGYSHSYKSIYAAPINVINEFTQCEECIKNAIEKPEYSSHLFRFPGGSVGGKYESIKKEAINLLNENQICHVDWNCLNKDAEGKFTNDQLINNVIETSTNKNSVVVLMHDAGTKISTAETLQSVIDYFKNNGYEFKTFYDIFK